MVCVADAMRLENAVRPEKTTVSAAVPCAAGHALSKRFLPEVRPQLSEKERAEGRFGAKTRPEQADPSAGWRKGEIARRGPQTPRHARRRPLPRAPENGERRFHLEKMVEGMLLSSKLLRIGRDAEFAAGNVSSGNARIETLPSDGRLSSSDGRGRWRHEQTLSQCGRGRVVRLMMVAEAARTAASMTHSTRIACSSASVPSAAPRPRRCRRPRCAPPARTPACPQ